MILLVDEDRTAPLTKIAPVLEVLRTRRQQQR
jgi:hypothetical protein